MRKTNCDACEGVSINEIKDKVWAAQLEHREIIINSVIDEAVIERVVLQIFNINKLDDEQEKEFERMNISGFVRDPITIFIHTPGGGVGASFAVVSAIESSKTPVNTVALGEVSSGGFLILIAGHNRYAQRHATMMYHELSSGTGGKATEVKEYGEYLEKLQQRISDYVTQNTAIPEEKLTECHLRKTDWYMDVYEALEYRVIDDLWPPDSYVMQESGCNCSSTGECTDGCECSCEEECH